MNERQAKRRADMPQLYRQIYDRALRGKSKAAGIKSFCLECMGWVRTEVRDCTTKECPLWAYKPYSISAPPQDEGLEPIESIDGAES